MKTKIIIIGLLAVAAFSPMSASGDRWYGGRGVGAGVAYGVARNAAYGGYGGYGYGGVGTAFSAQENARANTIRAQGEFNQMNTAAMNNYEDARSKYIENVHNWTQVYGEAKRAMAAQKEADHQAALAGRERAKEFQAAHPPATPPRLTSSQLNPATGQIQWPTALTNVAFEGNRELLDDLFKLRAHTSTNPDLASRVDKAVREMRDLLRVRIKDMPMQEYIQARRFLESMAVEGQSTVG